MPRTEYISAARISATLEAVAEATDAEVAPAGAESRPSAPGRGGLVACALAEGSKEVPATLLKDPEEAVVVRLLGGLVNRAVTEGAAEGLANSDGVVADVVSAAKTATWIPRAAVDDVPMLVANTVGVSEGCETLVLGASADTAVTGAPGFANNDP
jgi:hypothetical protein